MKNKDKLAELPHEKLVELARFAFYFEADLRRIELPDCIESIQLKRHIECFRKQTKDLFI